MSVAEYSGGRLTVSCTLFNVDTITVLNISKGGILVGSILNPTNQTAVSNINIVISPSFMQLTIIMTNCSVEGSYTVTINNGTSGSFTTWLLVNATSPLMTVARNKWLNQPFTITCRGNVGRLIGGSYMSKLYIQWGGQLKKENLYRVASPPICNDECQCSETIEIAITANETWNNTEVRCIALDKNDTVIAASVSEAIILAESESGMLQHVIVKPLSLQNQNEVCYSM
ncbi:uncharacterized protein LOC127835740 [Dreissena polymorpha]|uniref:uncharacterized protein LOC127835740 n=1 Tax=Dreissena polymorpha TaxID=45954 RepID=UPI0022653A51|nr:uncharacterized protein LOC127835740 [Dreissena polymorpha]